MKKFYSGLLMILSALVLSSCGERRADWENTLPTAVTTRSEYEEDTYTEETTAPTLPDVTTVARTSRTAATSSTPELATTTETETPAFQTSEETESGSTVSAVPGIPKVPLSEFTSTTALRPERNTMFTSTESSGSSETAPSNSTGLSSANENTSSSSGNTSQNITETAVVSDPATPYAAKSTDLRPYSYSSLSEKKVYIYDALITAIEQKKTSVQFSSVIVFNSEDYRDVYQILYNDECSLFYLNTKMQYAVNSVTDQVAEANIFYRYSDEEITRMQNAIDSEVNKVLSGIKPDMSEYDIVKLFYDYLAENVVYDESTENCRDIYGVFVDKKAICSGYAKAFEYLCSKAGIEAITITGDADEVPHMWNMVKIGGEWYHIDPTYAVTDSKVGKYVRYDYFCTTDEVIARSRVVYEQNYKYPAAVSTSCNYYVKNGLIANSWDEVQKMLTDRIIAVSAQKGLVVELQCGNKDTYDLSAYRLFDRSQAQALTIMQDALDKAENKYQCDNISYNCDENTYVLKIFLEYTE